MNEKVILPRFDLPRDSTRVAMRVLWAAGGLVVLATLILGLAMWRHTKLEVATADEAAAKAAAARRAAMAPPPAPAPAPVVNRAAQPGGLPATTTLAAVALAAPDAPSASVPAARAHHSHKGSGTSKARMRALIEQKGPAEKSASPVKKPRSNDDVIDRLLNGYK